MEQPFAPLHFPISYNLEMKMKMHHLLYSRQLIIFISALTLSFTTTDSLLLKIKIEKLTRGTLVCTPGCWFAGGLLRVGSWADWSYRASRRVGLRGKLGGRPRKNMGGRVGKLQHLYKKKLKSSEIHPMCPFILIVAIINNDILYIRSFLKTPDTGWVRGQGPHGWVS